MMVVPTAIGQSHDTGLDEFGDEIMNVLKLL
jgi:hypothetical protein